MDSGFDFDVIQRSLGYLFREGMTFTITLTLIAMTGGIIFGPLLALMRLSRLKPLSWLAGAYVDPTRPTPLVLVILCYCFAAPCIRAPLTRAHQPGRVAAR